LQEHFPNIFSEAVWPRFWLLTSHLSTWPFSTLAACVRTAGTPRSSRLSDLFQKEEAMSKEQPLWHRLHFDPVYAGVARVIGYAGCTYRALLLATAYG
jgi:hypothetical protein